METITIKGTVYTINYQETEIDDMVVDKNSNNIYQASISDADDLNWIIIK